MTSSLQSFCHPSLCPSTWNLCVPVPKEEENRHRWGARLSPTDAVTLQSNSTQLQEELSLSVTALKGMVIWLLGAKTYCKVTPCNKPHATDFWERHKRAAASAQVRRSWELSRKHAYLGFLGGVFQSGEWWDFKPNPEVGLDLFLIPSPWQHHPKGRLGNTGSFKSPIAAWAA